MAKEIKHIDISDTPELVRLAEEVQRSKQPHVLRRDSEDVAVVLPITARTVAGRREQVMEARIWADAGVTDTTDVWADYDPAGVRDALQQASGALARADRDELLDDIYHAREQDPATRPRHHAATAS